MGSARGAEVLDPPEETDRRTSGLEIMRKHARYRLRLLPEPRIESPGRHRAIQRRIKIVRRLRPPAEWVGRIWNTGEEAHGRVRPPSVHRLVSDDPSQQLRRSGHPPPDGTALKYRCRLIQLRSIYRGR